MRTTTAAQPFDGRRTLTLKAQKQYASAGKALTKGNIHSLQESEKRLRKRLSTACKHRESYRERGCSQYVSIGKVFVKEAVHSMQALLRTGGNEAGGFNFQ